MPLAELRPLDICLVQTETEPRQQTTDRRIPTLSINFTTSRQTMAATPASIPRFLLPRLSWSTSTMEARPASRFVSRAIREGPLSSVHRSIHSTSRLQNTLVRPVVQQTVANATASHVQSRKPFTSTSRQGRDHHFDTLKFVQRLKDEGFTEEQAVAMMKVLGDVVEER